MTITSAPCARAASALGGRAVDHLEAPGTDTCVTLTAMQRIGNAVCLQSDHTIINEVTIDGGASTYLSTGMSNAAGPSCRPG
ncbi:hypothetical protein [uncultured Sphingomonas sp.]|uniref:hypothetical protein n=1 Tax=uncultured Sphingomonas sp. TaxID=158754 RepID=UPI002596F64C|nr:hypothetical protein [uncultured Sphingomonas sp.]